MTVVLDIVIPYSFPGIMVSGDPWGIPSIYPALAVSIGMLVVVSYLTPKPEGAVLVKLFPETR
jgi:hypothetical protein